MAYQASLFLVKRHYSAESICLSAGCERSSLHSAWNPKSARATLEAQRDWLYDAQHLPIDNLCRQRPAPGDMNGQRIRQPTRWMFTGGDVRAVWQADYPPGNVTIQVCNTQQSPLATLIRLHKDVCANVAWILLANTFAISLAALGITGLVM